MKIINRHILSRLTAWKDSPGRKPLIIRGARQVGKSFAVRVFAAQQFSHFHEFNFERTPDLKKVFEKDFDPRRILSELETFAKAPIDPTSALIFFDEIQECPGAILALRYFYEELPNSLIIGAGSLLEFALSSASVPVGRIQYDYLYPLSFGEFLAAIGEEQLAKKLPRFEQGSLSFEEGVHNDLLFQKLREYMIVGGMPEVVADYAKHNSFESVARIQDDINITFRDDVHKYTKGDKQVANLEKILASISRYIGQEITYTTLLPEDSYKRTKASLDLLERAQLISVVRSANPSGLPLGAEASSKHFKCILLDIGLGLRMAGTSAKDILTAKDLLATYEGRLAEQFVGQQLLAESRAASEGRNLYCWIRPEKNAKAEVDYLIVREGKIIPVEVKAGKRGRLRSLDQILKTYPNLKSGLCLQHTETLREEETCTFAPLFTIL